jgi:hypothetical protein
MPFGEGVDQLADGAPGLRKVNPDGLVHQYEAPVPHIIPTQRSIKRGRRTPKTPFPRLDNQASWENSISALSSILQYGALPICLTLVQLAFDGSRYSRLMYRTLNLITLILKL